MNKAVAAIAMIAACLLPTLSGSAAGSDSPPSDSTLAVGHNDNGPDSSNKNPSTSTPHARVRLAIPGLERKENAPSVTEPDAPAANPLTPLAPLDGDKNGEGDAGTETRTETAPVEAGRELAKLDGASITELDVMRELWRLKGRETLDWMVGRAILRRETERRNIAIGEDEIDRRLAEHVEDLKKVFPHLSRPDDLTRAASGMGLVEYRERTVWTELALRRLMREDVEISDDMLKSYYAEKRALYVEPERVKISQIFVAPAPGAGGTPGAEEWSVAEAAIVKAHTRLRLGEDFKKVEEEVGPGGKGDGWFERGELLRELEDVAFTLGAGAVSAPIKTGHGYHIIRTEAKRERRTPEFDEIKSRLADEYREKFFLVMAGEYMTRLKDTALKDKTLVLTVGNGE